MSRCRHDLIGSSPSAVRWDGGIEAEYIEKRKQRIIDHKATLEKLKKPPGGKNSAAGKLQKQATAATQEELEEEAWEAKELAVSKSLALAREENDVQKMVKQLEAERLVLSKKLLISENLHRLRPRSNRILNNRYQLHQVEELLPATEVYRAYDLSELGSKVIRLHTLKSDHLAPEQRSASLQEMAEDCERYQRIGAKSRVLASLVDHFKHEDELGESYVTVWEPWDGDSLEVYLARHGGTVVEKDAKGIVLQLVSALRLMDSKNFLFSPEVFKSSRLVIRGGEVRVVGLSPKESKPDRHRAHQPCVDSQDLGEDDSLTQLLRGNSPEQQALKIIGEVLHEMLFNRSPQRRLSRADTMDSTEGSLPTDREVVALPDQPKISNECREFLLKLLDKEQPASLHDIDRDPFLIPPNRLKQ